MYCKYCGKQTENQDGVCDECLNRESKSKDTFFDDPTPSYAYSQPSQNVQAKIDKKYGFGESLTSTILGTVGYIFILIALEVIAILASYGDNATTGIVLFLFGLPMGIISLVYGIKSIQRFKEAKEQGVRPIATLILGIVGTVSAGLTLLFAFIVFCMIMVLI